jgi:phosphotransferase system HPr-like phosphotransfer protein
MRRSARALAVACLLLGLALTGRAGEDQAAAVIAKAAKAHFPKGIDKKNAGVRTKAKGMLHVSGLDLEFTQEVTVQAPNKFKEAMELTVMGNKVNVVTIYNGKEGWIRANDKEVAVTDEILTEFKEAAHMMRLMQGAFMNDKSVKFSLVGEVQVKGKPAVGVTLSREGARDVNLFFDKGTGLITKVERRARDIMSGQEVAEERYITEYQEVEGRKLAKKVEVLRDGKALLEAEVTEVQVFEKADDSEFAKPK